MSNAPPARNTSAGMNVAESPSTATPPISIPYTSRAPPESVTVTGSSNATVPSSTPVNENEEPLGATGTAMRAGRWYAPDVGLPSTKRGSSPARSCVTSA